MQARRALALSFASWLVVSSLGCAQPEHAVLIEARTQGDVETIQVTVIDLDGVRPQSRSSPRPVRRTAEDINEGEPIRIAVPLPGPMRVLVHVAATGRDPTQRYVATRCYVVGGVTRDTVLLFGPIGTDLDADGDAFPADPGAACRDPGEGGGTAPCDFACTRAEGADCDDTDPTIFPGAPELCRDGIDQDCYGGDLDVCEDRDGDGSRTCSGTDAPGTCDCDDNVAEIHPGATEICRDGIDQDCDGRDGRCDQDGDGFEADRDVGGSPDCDDTDPTIFPGAPEICTPDEPGAIARDEDCNGFIDDAADCTGDDLDRDGSRACTGLAPGVPCTRTDCDCNDCDAAVHPGAIDVCANGVDEDQSGSDAACPAGDADGDGFPGAAAGGADCDDTRADVFPGAPERCGDGVAQSCIADVACDGDGDMDGFVPPADCAPADAARAPGVPELCNAVDDDCDGTTNEVLSASFAGFPNGARGCVLGDARLGAGCAGSGACEIDFRTSVFHCGGCRVECNVPGGPVVADVCADGVCDCSSEGGIAACTAGTTCCAGRGCRNLAIELDDCGYCDRACTSASDRCSAGTCACGTLGRPCDAATDAGGTCCGAGCVDTQTDRNNCGACGNVCGEHSTCMGGTCRCDDGYGDCDGNQATGCEVDIRIDLRNCGACGAACSRAGATAECVDRVCRIRMCDPLRGNCDSIDPNGCEQSLETTSHCGTCGVPCSRPNATATCTGGTCRTGTCTAGFGNCDGNDANGCENTLDSLTHCGSCGTACARANATATCAGDMCRIATCAPGFGNCDGNDTNGCENTLDSLTHCGMCGTTCSRPNATATCAGDVCALMSCMPGFGNCDGNEANGCENTLDSLTDCGTCGTPCSRPNATASCSGDVCRVGTCNPGFGNCDGNDMNGCENTLDSVTHCGMCGTACTRAHATATCAGRSCAIASCDAGWGNCDMMDPNGCETATNTVMNCGACGNACSFPNASATCMGGTTCAIGACNAGFGNCDGMAGNGCERNLTTDVMNCGGCGVTCATNETCMGGRCVCGSTMGTVGGGPACLPAGDSCNGGGMCRCGSGPTCSGTQTCVLGLCV